MRQASYHRTTTLAQRDSCGQVKRHLIMGSHRKALIACGGVDVVVIARQDFLQVLVDDLHTRFWAMGQLAHALDMLLQSTNAT
jgi:ribonuclease P protein component